MGQYYLIVNLDAEEYLDPHMMGSGAKLWEICANDLPRALPYLLHQSTADGGGDPRDQLTEHLGRWAGDRLVVVGDYDDSDVYREAKTYLEEISDKIRPEINAFLPASQHLGESIHEKYDMESLFTE